MIDLMFAVDTYDWDLPVFARLGLKPFKTLKTHKTHKVGVVKTKTYTVKVYVEPMPAQFWKFDIRTTEGHHYFLTTGSGALSTHWDAVEKFATGMMNFRDKDENCLCLKHRK